MGKKTVLMALFLILAAALLLRVSGLGAESFWTDESATVYTTGQMPSEVIGDIYTTTRHAPEFFESGGTPPFYFLLANYWTDIFGLSEFKLRLLSVVFAMVSVYLIFLVGKQVFSEKVGLISSFMLSLSYLHISYSQEARVYSLAMMLTLLSVYFLLNALKSGKAAYWIAYVISSVLLMYSHYLAVFVLAFEYFFIIIFWKKHSKSLKGMVISCFGIIALYAVWIPVLIRQVFYSTYLGNYYPFGKNVLYDLAAIFTQYNGWFTPDLETRMSLRAVYHSLGNFAGISPASVTVAGWLTIASVLLLTVLLGWHFFAALFVKNRRVQFEKLKDERYAMLALWFSFPIVLPLVLTLIFPSSPVFGFVQHTLFALPAYLIIVSAGIYESKHIKTVLALFLILSALPLYSYYANFDKQQWREAAQYIEANRAQGELVVVVKANHVLPLGYYYKDMENVIGVRDVEELRGYIQGKNSFLLVYASEKYGDPQGLIKRYLDENYYIAGKTELTGVRIFRYISYGK